MILAHSDYLLLGYVDLFSKGKALLVGRFKNSAAITGIHGYVVEETVSHHFLSFFPSDR